MLDVSKRTGLDENHEMFRDTVRRFIAKEVTPHLDEWEEAGIVSREVWRAAGEAGILCPTIPEQYGGLGLDFSYNNIVNEELSYSGATIAYALQSDITAPYLLNYASEELKRKYLPKMIAGVMP